MKSASAGFLAILASGQYYKAELYDIVIGANHYYFTDSDAPVKVGSTTYNTGLTIQRGDITQSVGLEVNGLELDISPQSDNPAGTVLIEGIPFLQAVRQGIFDSARISVSIILMSNWADTSAGAVLFFQGRVNDANAGRLTAHITAHDDIEILNVSMPRNLVQTGCVHTLYDAGCTLLKSTFQVSGATSGSPTSGAFNSNLTQVDRYFDLGVITFTSGPNNGVARTVKSFVHASGVVSLVNPLPQAPGSGDTFTIVPGCPKTQAACSNASSSVGPAFNNLAHFKGMPYVPAPETPYDGGTNNPRVITIATQTQSLAGSALYGNLDLPGAYKP